MKKILLGIVLIFGTTLFAKDTVADKIEIKNPTIKAVPAVNKNTGVFMELKNDTDKDIKLIKAESDLSTTVELHDMVMENDVMKMRPVESILIKAKSSTFLKPGSLHVMLIGLKSPLKKGKSYALTLHFDNGQKEKITAPVKDVGPKKDKKHHHKH